MRYALTSDGYKLYCEGHRIRAPGVLLVLEDEAVNVHAMSLTNAKELRASLDDAITFAEAK